jgi:hypothetical protein
MPRRDATYTPRREFGNLTLIEADSRETWRWVSLENIAADFRFGPRVLGKSPGASLSAIPENRSDGRVAPRMKSCSKFLI